MPLKTHYAVAGRRPYRRRGGTSPVGISPLLTVDDLTMLAEIFGFGSVSDFIEFADGQQRKDTKRQLTPPLNNRGGRA